MSKDMTGDNNSMFEKSHSTDILNKLSQANGITIYIYSLDKTTLVNTFPSAFKAGKFFNVTHSIIMKYARKDIILKTVNLSTENLPKN